MTILQKTLFSPKKGPCGKMHTRQKDFLRFLLNYSKGFLTINDFKGFVWILNNFQITIFQITLFSPKKRPLRENAHAAKYFLVFSPKKRPPRENADTANIYFILLLFFSRYFHFSFFVSRKGVLSFINFHISELNV